MKWFTYSDYKNKINNGEIICGYVPKTGQNKNKICCGRIRDHQLYTNFHPLNRRCLSCRTNKGINWTHLYYNDLPNNVTVSEFNSNHINFHPNQSSTSRIPEISRNTNIRSVHDVTFETADDEILRFLMFQISQNDNYDEQQLVDLVSRISLETNQKKEEPIPIPISNSNIKNSNEKSEIEDCSICQTNKSNYVIVPCGHVCLCQECISNKFHEKLNNKCPICRGECKYLTKLFY